jgi:hypothetical protein
VYSSTRGASAIPGIRVTDPEKAAVAAKAALAFTAGDAKKVTEALIVGEIAKSELGDI